VWRKLATAWTTKKRANWTAPLGSRAAKAHTRFMVKFESEPTTVPIQVAST